MLVNISTNIRTIFDKKKSSWRNSTKDFRLFHLTEVSNSRVDSLAVDDHGQIVALVYPDFHQAEMDGVSKDALMANLSAALPEINKQLPVYAHVAKIEFMPEDFERTPKKSIKRYLYERK